MQLVLLRMQKQIRNTSTEQNHSMLWDSAPTVALAQWVVEASSAAVVGIHSVAVAYSRSDVEERLDVRQPAHVSSPLRAYSRGSDKDVLHLFLHIFPERLCMSMPQPEA
jgi:hypothetical protein